MSPLRASRHATETDRHLQAQLCAFNMAFAELGLRFRWDAHTLHALASIDNERARVATYIETHHAHLLSAYSVDFLCEAILALKNAQAPGEWTAAHAAAPGARREPAATAAAGPERDWSEAGLPALAGA